MYDTGNKKPLEDLITAWIGIKALPITDLNSFFIIGGYHGEPFEGPGKLDNKYWGGYCNHGNVLFPTWHRVYVSHIEKALQSIVPDVMMPYWDETSEDTLQNGIPKVLTDEKFSLGGVIINNPLRSYILPEQVLDSVDGADNLYSKPAGYETVRYPLSGLVGTPKHKENTAAHNRDFPNPIENTKLLNTNIHAWLIGGSTKADDLTLTPSKTGIAYKFYSCLNAPNYTAFSNTTSSAAWSGANNGRSVVSLESPHNDIHLAVGGFDINLNESGLIAGANGDMGENETAALDPIFFFHHCNIDRMFWLWQVKHDKTNSFDIIAGFQGTSASDQDPGPAVGQYDNEELTMDSPLFPFLKGSDSHYNSKDCINIETQLGFTYSDGSLSNNRALVTAKSTTVDTAAIMNDIAVDAVKKLEVSGINRALFRGSFVIRAYAEIKGKRHYLGHHSVLSRGNVKNCANCQTHLGVSAYFDLDDFSNDIIENATFAIEIQHRGHEGKDLPNNLKYKLKVI